MWPYLVDQLAEQMTNVPKLKGTNPAITGNR